MSKFIELTHKHSGSKLLININKIDTVNVFEGDVIVSLGESDDYFYTVTESYEQVKHLIETGEPLDNGDTKQEIEWFKQFDNAQREQIMLGLDSDVDVSLYAEKEFSWKQMQQIRFGQEKGADVLLYARKEFNWQQMRQIRWGQQIGVDVTLYAKVEFDFMQMAQIRWGLRSGIDVTLYLDSNIPWEEMEEIRERLEYEKKGDVG